MAANGDSVMIKSRSKTRVRPCETRRDRETVVSSRKPGLARNSRPIFKTLYCLGQIIKALLCLKYVLKRGFGWSRSYYSRETMRDSSLARSLVSQGWSREKSRSRKKTLETLRDLTLPMTIDTSSDPPSDSQSTIIIADNDVERSKNDNNLELNKDDETIHVKIWRARAGKNERHSKS